MWTEKFNRQYKEKIKKLTINFADIKKGETMLVSSPVSIAKYIKKIPKGKKKTVNEMREALAKKAKANKTCPVSTGIFLRMVIEDNIENFPYWRIIDQNHSLVTKLDLNKEFIINQRSLESIESD